MMTAPVLPPLKRYTGYPSYSSGEQIFRVQGQSFVGVSRILSATESQRNQIKMAAWRSRVGEAEAQQIIEESRFRGKRLHRLLASYLTQRQKQALPAIAESWNYWLSLQSVLNRIEQVHLIEGFVWHPSGFAGVTDALVEYKGQLCVGEWTTAPKPKRWEWLESKCLQLAAYAAAINRVYQSDGVRVSQGLIAVALPDEEAQVFLVSTEEMLEFWEQFLERFDQYQQLCQIS